MAATASLTLRPGPPDSARRWDGLFDGPFRHMAGTLLSASDVPAGTLRADCLAATPRLGQVLLRFQQQYPGADARAVVSMWSQWYFALLAAPLTLIGLRQGRLPPVSLRDVAVRLVDGRPAGMVLLDDAPACCGSADESARAEPALIADPFQRFAPLIDQHLAPMIDALRRVSSVSERLLWNNAAVQVEWVLRTARLSSTEAAAPDDTQALINQACRPDGTPNPLYRPVRPAQGGGTAATPVRRVCCLRYLLPGETYCAGACPLPIAKECL